MILKACGTFCFEMYHSNLLERNLGHRLKRHPTFTNCNFILLRGGKGSLYLLSFNVKHANELHLDENSSISLAITCTDMKWNYDKVKPTSSGTISTTILTENRQILISLN